jgi:hypothetical protein
MFVRARACVCVCVKCTADVNSLFKCRDVMNVSVHNKQNSDSLSSVTSFSDILFYHALSVSHCLLSMDRCAVIWNESGSGRGLCEAVKET